MSRTEVPVLDITVQKTHVWLRDLAEAMGWSNQHHAYLALRAVLHALRDRLPVEVTAKLGAQLPMLIRGIYYEGWVPSHTPLKIHYLEDFLNLVAGNLANEILLPFTEQLTKKVFRVMELHLSRGEIENLKKVLPQPIVAFWNG